MTIEWKPVDPCGDCNSKLKRESCKDWLECNDSLIYEGEVKGQKALLEYLKHDKELIRLPDYGHAFLTKRLKSMLEELPK